MSTVNIATKEICCKIVYYGPGLSGKTTNLLHIYKVLPSKHRSDMISLATDGDRTLFFDFLPLVTNAIKGYATKFQLYTVPGQVYYNATRKLVLQGVDGVIFVADSSWKKMNENHESFLNLKENLRDYGLSLDEIPYIIQYNKRDLPDVAPIEYLEHLLNKEKEKVPSIEAIAIRGVGVLESLNMISKMVLAKIISEISLSKEQKNAKA